MPSNFAQIYLGIPLTYLLILESVSCLYLLASLFRPFNIGNLLELRKLQVNKTQVNKKKTHLSGQRKIRFQLESIAICRQ